MVQTDIFYRAFPECTGKNSEPEKGNDICEKKSAELPFCQSHQFIPKVTYPSADTEQDYSKELFKDDHYLGDLKYQRDPGNHKEKPDTKQSYSQPVNHGYTS